MDVRSWMIKDKNDTTEEKEGKMITIFLKDGNDKKAEEVQKQSKKKMKQLDLNWKFHMLPKAEGY